MVCDFNIFTLNLLVGAIINNYQIIMLENHENKKGKSEKMKIYKNFFIVLMCTITLQSCLNNIDICVQGDCFNGEGTYNFSNGDSKGNFINGQLDKALIISITEQNIQALGKMEI